MTDQTPPVQSQSKEGSGQIVHGCPRHVLEWIAWGEWLIWRTNGGRLDAPARRWNSYPVGYGNPPYLASLAKLGEGRA